jgi:hypothetical protein
MLWLKLQHRGGTVCLSALLHAVGKASLAKDHSKLA